MTDLPVVIRPANREDVSFISHSWINSSLDTRDKRIRIGTYKAGQRRVIESLLTRATTLVATPEDDPALIAGWVACDPGTQTLHYIYVRLAFRGLGLAWTLQAAAGLDVSRPLIVSHLTDAVSGWGHTYDPFAAYEGTL